MLHFYFSLGLKGHNGLDFPAKDGEPVYFNCFDYEGLVLETNLDIKSGLGIVIGIKTANGSFKTIYWHLKDILVQAGQIISTGELIGYADNTGYSTGTHLHFGLKECDENWITINRGNGYDGCIDPEPFYQDIFVKDVVDNLNEQISIIKKAIKLIRDFFNGL